jgi:hypothetical protein
VKQIIGTDVGSYVFDPGSNSVRICGVEGWTLEQVFLVTNVTRGTILFNFADPTKGGAVAGNVLTVATSCAGMAATDRLQVIMDLPEPTADPLLDERAMVQVVGSSGTPLVQKEQTLEQFTWDTNLERVLGTAPLNDGCGRLRAETISKDKRSYGVISGANSIFGMMFEGMATGTIQLSGTWAGTITFEATADGGNWTGILGYRVDGGLVATLTTTASGILRFSATGLVGLRVRFSTATSGAPTVLIVASPAVAAQPLSQAAATPWALATADASLNTLSTALNTALRAAVYWGMENTGVESHTAWVPVAPPVVTAYTDPKFTRLPRIMPKVRVEVSGSQNMPEAQVPNSCELLTMDVAVRRLLEDIFIQLVQMNQFLALQFDGQPKLASVGGFSELR